MFMFAQTIGDTKNFLMEVYMKKISLEIWNDLKKKSNYVSN